MRTNIHPVAVVVHLTFMMLVFLALGVGVGLYMSQGQSPHQIYQAVIHGGFAGSVVGIAVWTINVLRKGKMG